MLGKIMQVMLFAYSFSQLFISCSSVNPFSCDWEINNEYISSDCGLTNGVMFERLSVLEYDSTGIPSKFTVNQRFECFNPGIDEINNYIPHKIMFDEPNGHYLWSADTVENYYVMNGKNRVLVDSLGNKIASRSKDLTVLSRETFDRCPVKFESSTWYFLKFFQQRYSGSFLYVDGNNEFKLYLLMSGESPV
jgi:hypothetical protein